MPRKTEKSPWENNNTVLAAILVVIVLTMFYVSTFPLSKFFPISHIIDEKIETEEPENATGQIETGEPQKYTAESITTESLENDYTPGIIIVKFKGDVTNTDSARAKINAISGSNEKLSKYGMKTAESVFFGTKNIDKKKEFGLDRVFRISVDSNADIQALVGEYKKDPNVEYAEPEYVPKLAMSPNDPLFPQQWHLNQASDYDIDASEAWDIETGKNVVIAMIDSDFEYKHSELINNVWQNLGEDADKDGHVLEQVNGQWQYDPGDINNKDDDANGYADDFIGWDFVSNTNNIYPASGFSHGTATSGVAAATGNNSLGIAGVCWKCKLMLLGLTLHPVSAIEYAVDNGANIISMSFVIGKSESLHDALKYAYSQNVVLVAAAGNTYKSLPNYPAAFNEVIAVAGTDKNDGKYDESSFGGWTDVAAPMVDIWVTNVGNTYGWATGTSVAAPIVSGLAGLIKSKNPLLTNKEIYSAIQTSADPVNTVFIGTGRVNAFRTLNYSSSRLVNVPVHVPIALIDKDLTVIPALPVGTINITGTANVVAGTSTISMFRRYTVEYGLGYYPSQWNLIKESTTQVNNGNLATLPLDALADKSYYTIKLTTYDMSGKASVDMINLYIDKNKRIFSTGGYIFSSPTLGDIDNDGKPEVVASSSDGKVYAWNDDETSVNGWPKSTGAPIYSSPALGDIDNDGKLEVVVGSDDLDIGSGKYKVYAWNDDGTTVTGWPTLTGYYTRSSPALGDIDNDGRLEIIIGSYDNKVYAFNDDGSIATGWPKSTSYMIQSSPSLGDIDNDKKLEIIVGTLDNKVYAFNDDGSTVSGWPKTTGGSIYSSPALGDIDNDKKLEIVVGSYDNKVYAWKGNGTAVANWPQSTGGSVHSSPALGDIDNDSKLEIVVGSRDKKFYAWKNNGAAVSGWPKTTNGEFYSSPALADIDNDNKLEIAIGSYDSYIYLSNDDWSYVTGWPQYTFSRAGIDSTPAFGDIDGDGLFEMIIGVDRYVYVFELQGTLNPLRLDWPMSYHDAKHSNLYVRNCGDILNGQCSSNKPLFCTDGSLVNKCSACSCPSGQTCLSNGNCKAVTPSKPPVTIG